MGVPTLRSAPQKPTQRCASSASSSRRGGGFQRRVWIPRMDARAGWLGSGNICARAD